MTTNQKRINNHSNNNKDNSHKSLLIARENADNAKENAMATMSRTSKESQVVNKPDETLAKILGEAEQRIQKQTISEHHDIPLQAPLTDIFPEIKRKTISPEVTRSQQLEQLLNDLTEEKTQKKIEENNEEARIYNIEVQKALDEVNKIKKAAENAVRQAQEEASRYREELETARNDTRLAIALAQEKVKTASEEIKAVQQQAFMDTNRARADVLKAREEAEIARRESRQTISRAEAESRKAREETEAVKRQAAETIRRSQEESRKIKEEAQTSLTRINQSLFQARRHVAGMTREDACKIRQAVQGTRQPLNTSAEESTAALPEKGVNARIAEVKEQQLLDKIMEMHHPLHSISGFTRMILDDNICDTAAQKEFLAMILQQSENLKLQLDNMYCLLKANPE
jgi:hypothetical protein